MTTFTEILGRMKLQENKENVLQHSINNLNKKFQKYWTPLFNGAVITEKWSDDNEDLSFEVGNANHVYNLVVKNTTIDKIEILGIDNESNSKAFRVSLEKIYSQLLGSLMTVKLRDYFDVAIHNSLLTKYFGETALDFNSITAVMKYILGQDLVNVENNNIIINNIQVDCLDLEFIKEYYAYPKTYLTRLDIEKDYKKSSLKTFDIIQKHNNLKVLLPKIFDDLALAYRKVLDKYSIIDKLEAIDVELQDLYKKHQFNTELVLTANSKKSNIIWKLTELRPGEKKENSNLLHNYTLLKIIKDLSKEDFSKNLKQMENQLLKQLVSEMLTKESNRIKNNSLERTSCLENIRKSFVETVSYNGEQLTIFKREKYFTLAHDEYKYYCDFKNDRLLEFSKLDNNISNITCYADFEKEIIEEANFLIEFLNS